jgi:hydroxymethylpyrimidine/phosphomethylpyrimidine kinase
LSKDLRGIAGALSIAGSDSGGGAGIQADLKTFAALGVHGTTVVTCITAQNPRRVLSIQPCNVLLVQRQLQAVFSELPPTAAKTGMLYSGRIIDVVADFFKNRRLPLVVDPVMISTSGSHLLQTKGLRNLCLGLLPFATVVTPNVPETEVLLGRRLHTPEDLRSAARELNGRFGCAALVKGGHLRGLREAVDLFYDGQNELLLSAPFLKGINTHGTGCTFSAAITAFLARGFSLSKAVSAAKVFITEAIAQNQLVHGHRVLKTTWGTRRKPRFPS